MIAWTIAGSDPTCGAGIQADLQVFQHLGVQAASIITAITAQNSKEIIATQYVSHQQITAQVSALQHELTPAAIKIGMLGSQDAIKSVGEFLKTYSGKVILDPIIKASNSGALHHHQNYPQILSQLYPYIDLLTPNIVEAEMLADVTITSYDDIKIAAKKLLSFGIKNILIKGGHFQNDHLSQDYWTNGSDAFWLATPRLNKNCRGTGCVFSSAITAALALGYELKDALVIAKMYINRGIRLAKNHYLHHAPWPENEIDLPYLSHDPLLAAPSQFQDCSTESLGLYPIVDSSDWLKKLLPLGVKTIQLRIKNKTGNELENEIKESIIFAKKYGARLFINDFWELAIKHDAYGVHLGQEDLHSADIHKIHQAGLRLGVSTHCYYEVARAHAFHPSYLACGPIFTTTSKIMPFAPQGLANLARWQRLIKRYPLVAIGGIDANKISDVVATGVSGVAMISAITKAQDPISQTKYFLQMMER